MDAYNIERFITAQDGHGQYVRALKEFEDGQKRSHWICYLFTQIKGLGHSAIARAYAIGSLEEARGYWENAVMRERLVAISKTLFANKGKTAEGIFGWIDAMKVQSCMTLFDLISSQDVLEAVLDAFYKG